VFLCLIAAFIGVDFTGTLTFFQSYSKAMANQGASDSGGLPYFFSIGLDTVTDAYSTDSPSMFGETFDKVLDSLIEGNVRQAETDAVNSHIEKENYNYHGLEIGHQRGVFSSIVNTVSSGSILLTIYASIASVVKSHSWATAIFILLCLAVTLFVWMFILNTYRVSYRRLFMENRIYDKVPLQKIFFLLGVKRVKKVSFAMLKLCLYQLFWEFTIVGGIIKYFSYFMVPYILAENPDLTGRQAITLSRKMMKGHKWQCFIMIMSFILWDILNSFTLGLLAIFYLNPYKEATYCEYYNYIRAEAIKNNIENIELLNDKYLYEKPEKELLERTYSDIIEIMNEPEPKVTERKGFWKFMLDVLGIIPSYDKSEKSYEALMERRLRIGIYQSMIEGKMYPLRLFTIPPKEKNIKVTTLHYMRHYSIPSLILIFFFICIFGWLWEVVLHMMVEGGYVNRGVLHGPWLPIYGGGSVMILVLLNKLRSRPAVQFFSAMVLCGVVEYFTSVFLEATHNGKMWWDYSGYFLNLHGRICAEGLLVFGLGGIAIVYFLAPMLDNIFRRIPLKITVPICAVLLAIFLADQAYSAVYPNMGEGVTEYDTELSKQINKEAEKAENDDTTEKSEATTAITQTAFEPYYTSDMIYEMRV
ncbi:MAG: DUF975 family protein, partial [Ruminococcus sp.]|nr:DUF975 family protein [Ruminococcus sp.]